MVGEFLDKLISVVSPELGARRAASRLRYEALSTYSVAERSRRNRDWNAKNVSADSAILGDIGTILPRARSIQRDNWAGNSICKAFERNVIGRGISPVSTAADESGAELRKYNEQRDKLFMHWASRAKFCDVEKRQTFWRKQKMAIGEMVGVGQHFVIWSYTPNPQSVGLRLQSYEPEQLDFVKLVNNDNGNQIRHGIEIDDYGAAVAYWFYPRPINDYYGFQPSGISGSLFWESVRHPAERVFHVMDQNRTRQTHGITWMHAVMQKIRDTATMDDAMLLAAKLEASIGLVINTEPVGGTGGGFGKGLPGRNTGNRNGTSQPDDTSNDGGPQMAIEPAMIFRGLPGETIQGMPKQAPGNNYDDFMRMNLRTAGAGCGLSYDVIARDYDQGSYSSKRQGAIEDRREYYPLQDLAVDTLCQNVLELFTTFAWLEGKLSAAPDDFLENNVRYQEAEWCPDGFELIDMTKEASAQSMLLDKRLITRKEIMARAGRNWRSVFAQIADEQTEADRVGITLPDVEPSAPKSAGVGPPPPDDLEPKPASPIGGSAIKKKGG